MKNLENLMVSVLKVEEMFNVRGGDDETTTTSSSKNNTSEGEDEDIIL